MAKDCTPRPPTPLQPAKGRTVFQNVKIPLFKQAEATRSRFSLAILYHRRRNFDLAYSDLAYQNKRMQTQSEDWNTIWKNNIGLLYIPATHRQNASNHTSEPKLWRRFHWTDTPKETAETLWSVLFPFDVIKIWSMRVHDFLETSTEFKNMSTRKLFQGKICGISEWI